MKAKKDKPKKAKAKTKKSELLTRLAELDDRVTRLEQAQSVTPAPQTQSLPEGGLPAQGAAIANP